MQENTDPKRNIPADEGRRNDPHIRDEDARQPGVNTMSSAPNDEANQHLSRTASDGFRQDGEGDDKADKKFDE
jgi:hypothetical protein